MAPDDMTKVVIAEKPSVANDLAKILGATKNNETHWEGNDLIITWAVGHLLELKTPEQYDEELKNWWKSVDKLPFIPSEFEVQPVKGRGQSKKQLQAIKKILKDKSIKEVINACDAAREGELIFRRIVQWAGVDAPITRLWLQSMTEGAIKEAWERRESSTNFDPLSDAAYSRSEADWIIGMNGSRIASISMPKTKRDGASFSIGRVQTATLAMIVDHELNILAHVPKPFWELNVDVTCKDANWKAKWTRKNHKDQENRPEYKATRIVEIDEKSRLEKILESDSPVSIEVDTRESIEKSPLHFDLTSLQREANNLFSWSARRTLSVAQDLYDRFKLTTYPRTDSRHLPEDMIDEVDKIFNELGQQKPYSNFSTHLLEQGVLNQKTIFNDKKVSDHYAIIPTGNKPPSGMDNDHKKLYDLITRQFFSAFYPNAVWEIEKRIAIKENEQFLREARELKVLGWREVRGKKGTSPEGWGVVEKSPSKGNIDNHTFSEEHTKPPNRIKEAGLLKLMENAGRRVEDEDFAEAMKGKGLGTPATRAETIEKLLARNYIQRMKTGGLYATAQGIRLIEFLRLVPVDWITSPALTGEMESVLSDVQRGDSSRTQYMQHIHTLVHEMVEKIKNHQRSVLYQDIESVGICPSCNTPIEETALSYRCEQNQGKDSECKFIIWKDSSGRWFDRQTVSRLLQVKKVENLHGFFSQSGDSYNRTVEINDYGMTTLGSNSETTSKDDISIGNCPTCDDGNIRIGESAYACDNESCKFRGINKEMCKREITVDEAKSLIENGRTALLDDFISKRGSTFSAYLVVKGQSIRYEFPPRGADPSAKKFPVVEGVVGVCSKTGVNIIESETHYVAEANDKGCNLQIPREISKREITREEAKELVEKRKIGPFEDLLSKKTGKPFTAILYLKANQQIGYRFAKRS